MKIRIGKDIAIRWSVLTNGEPEDLHGRDLRLCLKNMYGGKQEMNFVSEGNTIVSRFLGKDQKRTGDYSLTLWENYGKENQTAVDACNVFTLVSSTCLEETVTGLEFETVEVAPGNLSIGVKGESAYEAALKNGFVGTEKEWLASLKGEKGDKGDPGEQGEQGIQGEQGEKGEPFRYSDFTPEQIQALKKPATDAAEELADLGGKLTQLSGTVTAQENQRVQAENLRASNETARQKAEEARIQAETNRNRTFNTLKQQSETATDNANTATEKANTAAEKADASATQADTSAQKADTAAANANKEATNANQAADLARQAKELLFRDLWNQACGQYGKYNEETGFYELNELTDITYEQAAKIYSASMISTYTQGRLAGDVRTLIPPYFIGHDLQSGAYSSCYLAETIRTARTSGPYNGVKSAFSESHKLRKVIDEIQLLSGGITIENAVSLEYIKVKGIQDNCSLKKSPLLGLESLSFMINEARNTKSITFTVHPDVYSKLTDESNTEWHAILQKATEKNISFATE